MASGASNVGRGGNFYSMLSGMLLGVSGTVAVIYYCDPFHRVGKGSASPLEEKIKVAGTGRVGSSTYAKTHADQLSGTFLTDLLAALWKQIANAAALKIRSTIEPMFPELLPGPVQSLKFTKVSLGDVPLKLDNIVVHERQTNPEGVDYVEFEMDVVWDGQMDMQLKADYLGTFGVQHVKLQGRMSILLQPLSYTALPCFTCAQYGFIHTPQLEMDFTGLAQAADFAGIRESIRAMILQVLASKMVLPYRKVYKMDDDVPYFATYVPPLGVARLQLLRGRGFQTEKRGGGLLSDDIPDCYCLIQMGPNSPVWKTAVVKDSLAPEWENERFDFLFFHYDQVVEIQAWDEDAGIADADDPLGEAVVSVGELLLAGGTQEVELFLPNGKPTGAFVTLSCNVLPLVPNLASILQAKPDIQETNVDPQSDNLIQGLLTILVSQAFDVPVQNAKSSFFVQVTCGKEEFCTPSVVGESHPQYECVFRLPLKRSFLGHSNAVVPLVTFALVQGVVGASTGNKIVGTFQILASVIVESPDATQTGRGRFGSDDSNDSPSLEYSLMLRGLAPDAGATKNRDAMPGAPLLASTSRALGESPGTQLVKITIVRGWGFPAERQSFLRLFTPDVYCKIKFGSSPAVWRTATVRDSIQPEWNESQIFPLRKQGQVLQIDVLDENGGRNDPDNFLGNARISVGKLLLSGGSSEIELMIEGKPTGIFLEIECELVSNYT